MRVIHRCTGERDLCETLLEHECLENIVGLSDATTREALFNKETSVKAYDGGKTFTCQCGKCGDTFTLSKYDHMKLHDIAYGKCANGDAYARSIMARTVLFLHCNQVHTLDESPYPIYVAGAKEWSKSNLDEDTQKEVLANGFVGAAVSQEDIDRVQEQLKQTSNDPNLTFYGGHFDVPLFEIVSCPSIKIDDIRKRNVVGIQADLARGMYAWQAEEDKRIFAAIDAAVGTSKRGTKTTIAGRDLFVDTTPKFVEISWMPSEVMIKVDSIVGKTLQVGQLLSYNSNGELVPAETGKTEIFAAPVGAVMSVSKDGTQARIRVSGV